MRRYKEFESLREFMNRRIEELGRSGELMAEFGKLTIDDLQDSLEAEYYDAAGDAAEMIQGCGASVS